MMTDLQISTRLLTVCAVTVITLGNSHGSQLAPSCMQRQNSLVFFLACYQSEYHRFPKNLGELVRVAKSTVNLEGLLLCPASQEPYNYVVSGDGSRFQIKCKTKGHPYYSSKTGLHRSRCVLGAQQLSLSLDSCAAL